MVWSQTEPIIQIGTIIAAFLVTITPLKYGDYSPYAKKSWEGVRKLTPATNNPDRKCVSELKKGETGFSEILDSLQPLVAGHDVRKIGIVVAADPDTLEDHLNRDERMYGVYPNAAAYVDLSDGSRHSLRYNAQNSAEVTKLRFIKPYVAQKIQERANWITAAIAVLWTTMSVVQII